MEKGKTIRQIAEELGVSKQAIHQKRKSKKLSEALKPFTSTVDGVVYISVDGETLIKSAFLEKERKQDTVNEPSTVDGSFTPVVDGEIDILVVLKSTIDTLQEQLKSKDEQIKKLQSELEIERKHSREQSERISVLADQAQKLQLAQMTPELTDGKIMSDDSEKKIGLISKIFKRK